MATPTVEWRTASPLWGEALKDSKGNNGLRFRQPALLRFATDTFIDDLQALLDDEPLALKTLVTQRETWEQPRVGWLDEDAFQQAQPPKLYQPAHGRFYLVAASLVCRIPGLPDKTIDTNEDEKASFVLRRLVAKDGVNAVDPKDPDTYDEFGWLAVGWQKITPAERAHEGEERLPMFPVGFVEDKRSARRRRMLAGFVPVASRETFQAGPKLSPLKVTPSDLSGDPLADPRIEQYTERVRNAAAALKAALDSTENTLKISEAREVFIFLLLDLAEFLDQHLKTVWDALPSGAGLAGAKKTLFDALNVLIVPTSGSSFRLPPLLIEVYSARVDLLTKGIGGVALTPEGYTEAQINAACALLLGLDAPVKNALGAYTPSQTPSANTLDGSSVSAAAPPGTPKYDPTGGAYYVTRCVYDRPKCKGLPCAVVTSAPSQPFQLAPFFDPEAPARPIRITMPVDTSIEGLRKFPKNVSMLISNQLRNQMARIQSIKLEDLDKGKVGDEGSLNLGMICSLSIPIITICALILLMIIVSLLNIVFWWLPLFKICFPLNLKAK